MKIKILGKKSKGFSLVELMVVVAIIGILTSIAVPKFNKFRAKAIRAEATATLTNINTLQQLYYTDNDAYTTNPTTLGFSYNTAGGMSAKYTYALSSGDLSQYTATATSKKKLCPNENELDLLMTTDTGELSVKQDGLGLCL